MPRGGLQFRMLFAGVYWKLGEDCLPVELGGSRALALLQPDFSARFTFCTWRSLASCFLQVPLFRVLCAI